MWISKKKYEAMTQNVVNFDKLIRELKRKVTKQQQCIDRLMSMHDLKAIDAEYSGGTYFSRMYHKEPTINLEGINNLTFTELAEYVINDKPIVRTRTEKQEVVVYPKEK